MVVVKKKARSKYTSKFNQLKSAVKNNKTIKLESESDRFTYKLYSTYPQHPIELNNTLKNDTKHAKALDPYKVHAAKSIEEINEYLSNNAYKKNVDVAIYDYQDKSVGEKITKNTVEMVMNKTGKSDAKILFNNVSIPLKDLTRILMGASITLLQHRRMPLEQLETYTFSLPSCVLMSVEEAFFSILSRAKTGNRRFMPDMMRLFEKIGAITVVRSVRDKNARFVRNTSRLVNDYSFTVNGKAILSDLIYVISAYFGLSKKLHRDIQELYRLHETEGKTVGKSELSAQLKKNFVFTYKDQHELTELGFPTERFSGVLDNKLRASHSKSNSKNPEKAFTIINNVRKADDMHNHYLLERAAWKIKELNLREFDKTGKYDWVDEYEKNIYAFDNLPKNEIEEMNMQVSMDTVNLDVRSSIYKINFNLTHDEMLKFNLDMLPVFYSFSFDAITEHAKTFDQDGKIFATQQYDLSINSVYRTTFKTQLMRSYMGNRHKWQASVLNRLAKELHHTGVIKKYTDNKYLTDFCKAFQLFTKNNCFVYNKFGLISKINIDIKQFYDVAVTILASIREVLETMFNGVILGKYVFLYESAIMDRTRLLLRRRGIRSVNIYDELSIRAGEGANIVYECYNQATKEVKTAYNIHCIIKEQIDIRRSLKRQRKIEGVSKKEIQQLNHKIKHCNHIIEYFNIMLKTKRLDDFNDEIPANIAA